MRKIEFKITKAEEGAAFAVHVVPYARRNEVVGKHGDALKVKMTTKTAKGIANDQLIDFLCQKLGIEKKNIEIAAGRESKEKMIVVVGMSPTKVEDILLN
ncbi:DUF167 domain-containing protein [Anaerolineales bacterium HSG6]|nr:DUF167 domain-containing protein [Anaerolineales bacterium HSG6]MDM8530138.1 DUF167 domain-containing protein [Anaerolineales bacterium HSG25]